MEYDGEMREMGGVRDVERLDGDGSRDERKVEQSRGWRKASRKFSAEPGRASERVGESSSSKRAVSKTHTHTHTPRREPEQGMERDKDRRATLFPFFSVEFNAQIFLRVERATAAQTTRLWQVLLFSHNIYAV